MSKNAASNTEVTTTSRVAVVVTQDGFRIRGKITLSFQRAHTVDIAEQAAAVCERLLGARLREEESKGAVPVEEAELGAWLQKNLPSGFPRVRVIRIHALHVLGAMTRSGTMAAATAQAHSDRRPAPHEGTNRPTVGRVPSTASSSALQIKWVRRRGAWARQLSAVRPDEPLARLLQPIATSIRDAAARIATSTLVAIDHEGFDLYACLEGKAHAELAIRLRAEALALACAHLAAGLSQAPIPASQTTPFLEGVLRLLDPARVLAAKLPNYLAQADPATAYLTAAAALADVTPSTLIELGLRTALTSLSDDVRAHIAYIQQRLRRV